VGCISNNRKINDLPWLLEKRQGKKALEKRHWKKGTRKKALEKPPFS
jgi:hypothetical protein